MPKAKKKIDRKKMKKIYKVFFLSFLQILAYLEKNDNI